MDFAVLIGVVFFVGYFIVDYASNQIFGNDFLSKFMIMVYFFFVYANVDPTIAPFYLIMGVVAFMFSIFRGRSSQLDIDNSTSLSIQGSDGSKQMIKGLGFYVLNIVFGLASFGLMLLISGSQPSKAQVFIGVPSLTIVALQANLSYATVMALGIIENQFIVIVREVMDRLKKPITEGIVGLMTGLTLVLPFFAVIFVILTQIMLILLTILGPVILSALLFSIFHLAAYSVVFSALFFAWLVMVIWLIAYQVTGNDIVMNVGHMLWNAFVTYLRRGGGF